MGKLINDTNDIFYPYMDVEIAARKTGKFLCKAQGVDFELITTNTRKKEVVYARQILYYLIQKYGNWKLWTIATFEMYHRKDHATVLHGVKKVKGFMKVDKVEKMFIQEAEMHFRKKLLQLKNSREKRITIKHKPTPRVRTPKKRSKTYAY